MSQKFEIHYISHDGPFHLYIGGALLLKRNISLTHDSTNERNILINKLHWFIIYLYDTSLQIVSIQYLKISWHSQLYKYHTEAAILKTMIFYLLILQIIFVLHVPYWKLGQHCLGYCRTFELYKHESTYHNDVWGSLWLWLYGSWIYNYLCNQCLSSLTLNLPQARCTQYIMWSSLIGTCGRLVVFSGYSGFLHQ